MSGNGIFESPKMWQKEGGDWLAVQEGVTCLKTKEQFKMSDSYGGGIDLY